MKPLITTETRNYITCPHCNKEKAFEYTHLASYEKNTPFGNWFCKHCFKSISGIIYTDGDVTLDEQDQIKMCTPVLVLLNLQNRPDDIENNVFFIKQHFVQHFEGKLEEALKQNHEQYYFDEHTCPSNVFQMPVICDDDSDMHGLLKHVKTILFPTVKVFNELQLDDFGLYPPASGKDDDLVNFKDLIYLTSSAIGKLFFKNQHYFTLIGHKS